MPEVEEAIGDEKPSAMVVSRIPPTLHQMDGLPTSTTQRRTLEKTELSCPTDGSIVPGSSMPKVPPMCDEDDVGSLPPPTPPTTLSHSESTF